MHGEFKWCIERISWRNKQWWEAIIAQTDETANQAKKFGIKFGSEKYRNEGNQEKQQHSLSFLIKKLIPLII